MDQLYENIKIFRKKRGLSQEELAELTGYSSRTSIAKIEAGKVNLPADKIMLFANALNVMYSELTGWTYDEEGVPSYARTSRTRQEICDLIQKTPYSAADLAEIIRTATEKLRSMVIERP